MSKQIEGQIEMMQTHQTDCRRLGRVRDLLLFIPLLALLAFGAGPASAQDEPQQAMRPGLVEELGLWWGMSFEDVLALDEYTLEYMGRGDSGDHYAATAFPPLLEDLGQIILFFGFDDRLWRLAFLSIPEKDGSGVGTALFARYDVWKGALDGMYGAGQSFHQNTSPDVGRPDLILASLAGGKAWHFTEYDRQDVHVQLGVKGTSMIHGHTAIYIKNIQMGEKVRAEREAIEQSTSRTAPDPATETEEVE